MWVFHWLALEKYNFTFKFHFSFSYPKFATNEQGKTLYKGYKLNLVLMEAEIDATVLMEAEMGRRLGGQHWVPTARWPQAVPLSATTCELDTRCLLATRQIFYCCPHQLTSTANHCRQLPNQWNGWQPVSIVAATTANNRHLALKLSYPLSTKCHQLSSQGVRSFNLPPAVLVASSGSN